MVSRTVKKPTRPELARRRKIRKFWAEHPERREAQSRTAKQFWTPERCESKSREMIQFFADPDHPERREAKRKSMKRVMRSRKRRAVNSENMKKLKANPEFEARRRAGFSKAEGHPERKAIRRATFAKTLAVPSVSRRRIKNSKKATSSLEYRAAMSAEKKKFWDELRALIAGLKGTKKSSGNGRPRMDERYKAGATLRERGETWREITRKLDPDFVKNPAAAMHRMRVAVTRLRRSENQESPR